LKFVQKDIWWTGFGYITISIIFGGIIIDINDIVTDWLSDKNELQKYQSDFCQYFRKAILSAQNKNRTYFGTKKVAYH